MLVIKRMQNEKCKMKNAKRERGRVRHFAFCIEYFALNISRPSRRGLSLTGMAYQSRWNSTDQVPQRLIDSGELSRFGSMNPTDGGRTRRLSLSGQWFDKGPEGETKVSAYAIDYRFDLFSDFTYFLDDPVNGEDLLSGHGFGGDHDHDPNFARKTGSGKSGTYVRQKRLRCNGVSPTPFRRVPA